MTHIILHPNWYHHFPSIFQCSQHFPSLFPWSSASSQHLQTRSRRPVACVYSRTEEMVSSGMDSSSIRFSQKFEHPKSSPHDFSYFSLPPILSVAHMFSDNSWALIQCHRLLALTHESTIWLALHNTSWNIRKVNPNVEVSGSPDTVLSGGEPQCWDTLGALDLFFRSLQYRPTWGQPDISWFIPSHPSNYEYDISIYIMISWYVYTMYTINIHQLRRIFLFFLQIYGCQHSVGELCPVSGHWQGWESKDATTSLAAIHLKETRAWLRIHMAVCQNLVPLVNIKIAGKWMFIPLKNGINRYWSIWIHGWSWMLLGWPGGGAPMILRCPEVLKELPGVSPDRTWQSSTPCETKKMRWTQSTQPDLQPIIR